jgi:branched-chain amino acid transport system permease protein
MSTFLQVLVSGVLVGGLYGVISSGLSLSFGITRIVNFAHADFVTIGMYLSLVAVGGLGSLGLFLTPVFGLAIGLLGVLVYLLLLRRTAVNATTEDEAHLPQIVITAAVGIFVQSLLLALFTSTDRSVSTALDGAWRVAGLSLSKAQVVAFVVAAVAFAVLDVVVNRTEFGRGLRAVVDDADAAAMVGVNRRRVFSISSGIGVGLAGLAGGLLATYQTVNPTTGFGYLALAFVTVVLGGLGSIRGAFVAGVVIGVVQQATATYVALDLQNQAVWIGFLVVLLVRPMGLFGKRVTT